MYDRRMREVKDTSEFTDKELIDEIIWWAINLRRIPAHQFEGCTPAPNSPTFLDRKPTYYRCAPRIYWAAIEDARRRGVYA